MPTFNLEITIDPENLSVLKNSKYNLCIAKRCNGIYTVVWSGNTDYLAKNLFEWTDEYQVFGTNKFKSGALVGITTKRRDIEFGQRCEVNPSGDFGEATGTPNNSGKFTIVNHFGEFNFGLGCSFNGEIRPFFATPATIIPGTEVVEPSTTIKVWFAHQQRTGMMIQDEDSEGVELIYYGKETQKIAYKGWKWSIIQ